MSSNGFIDVNLNRNIIHSKLISRNLQGSHRQGMKNFNDFSMIFQDKNHKNPW